jgi:hypothetical protein
MDLYMENTRMKKSTPNKQHHAAGTIKPKKPASSPTLAQASPNCSEKRGNGKFLAFTTPLFLTPRAQLANDHLPIL